ncbi:hypothetical protein L6164_037550 [Bauhinia variegata]|uniref:Uncharacterized protein n=1 Tax=Bauhinia variegata TaxID=167791 RepID=A0ACB9KKC0_BAUVA|nr:hypothetical protein L6164_037550 [Bauhinia variegata]
MKANPFLWACTDNLNRLFIFHAIKFRQAKVVSRFLTEDIAALYFEDRCKNNVLHMAAKLEPSTQLTRISGAALKMQRELQWFKEVKNIIPPARWERRNNDGIIERNKKR